MAVENSNKQSVKSNKIKIKVKSKTKPKTKGKTKSAPGPTRLDITFLCGGAVAGVAGITLALLGAFTPHLELAGLEFPTLSKNTTEDHNIIYSDLTGLPLENAAAKTAPAFCIQIPNGTDGGRPQAGLNQAGVIFEAIAERGITRFAAIFQNPTSSIIGPIRSLRTYYLEWDTPFDCTITHAGGAADALAAVSHGYRNLDENYQYMYRGTVLSRLWNNLFTTSENLKNFSTASGFTASNVQGFSRMTPSEAKRNLINETATVKLEITEPTTQNTAELSAKVPEVEINFGNYPSFNIRYDYDAHTNSYVRSYASGGEAKTYDCPDEDLGERDPETTCELKSLSPSVVVAMVVNEKIASDGYHESIQTIGNGTAYIFQNGIAVEGTWQKGSAKEQIRFFDKSGNAILLVPGQTIVETVPGYGSVEY